jgi:hypothetical protein
MAAPITVLESLLERVRRRALEPRPVTRGSATRGRVTPVSGSRAVARARMLVDSVVSDSVVSDSAPPVPVRTRTQPGPPPLREEDIAQYGEEDIEEYDEELVEIVDEVTVRQAPSGMAGPVTERSDPPPPPRPISEWASTRASAPPISRMPLRDDSEMVTATATRPTLSARVVARSPVVSNGPVAYNVGQAPAGDADAFTDLLDYSLSLIGD